MSEKDKHAPEESVNQDPELMRARDLFVDMFQDQGPLINLGYAPKHRQQAVRVLTLLEDVGRLVAIPEPHLIFGGDINDRYVQIDRMHDGDGFKLHAFEEDSRDLLTAVFFNTSLGTPFEDFPGEVVHMGLFPEELDITLDNLVRELHKGFFTTAPLGLKTENRLTQTGKNLGVVGVYKAAWVDEQTKLEFVAKLSVPEEYDLEPTFVRYRRLAVVRDDKGSFVPFGKKPSRNVDEYKAILAAKGNQLSSGSLRLGSESAE